MPNDRIHVLPIEDLREHVCTTACWCRPRLESVAEDVDAIIVVHHSADGRELIEQHGIN